MGLLSGRLGLDTARIPHSDRDGMIWLSRGTLSVSSGCLIFQTAGFESFSAGEYSIPHQTVSAIMLGPGSSVTHDALRILAKHGTALLAVGEDGVRFYTAPPLRPDSSTIARNQMKMWADKNEYMKIVRKMYAWRFSEIVPRANMDVLRGLEGARVRKSYSILAEQYDLPWEGRNFNRNNPAATDTINTCLNHVATAMYAASSIATNSLGAIPQLGFIHEAAGDAFCLDIADLYRTSVTIPVAFSCAKIALTDPNIKLEQTVRQTIGKNIREKKIISDMIEKIKELFNVDDSHSG
jgi:CRISP-associated protein Cas1